MAGFNPEVFRWARESAGLALEDAARAIGIVPASLAAIEAGEKTPSRTALVNMAKAYRRSLLTLYLPAPPQRGERGEDFRTVAAEHQLASEADIDALVRDLRARQSLMRSVLEDDEDMHPLNFVGSATLSGGVHALSDCIGRLLGLSRRELRAQKDAESAFALLRARAEQAGVFVLLVGHLGSHHSAIPVEAFRGFAIADPIAPFIVINDGDAKAAWSFTLLHELAHLFLGATGVSAGTPELQIERFCNDVASEFLVPRSDIETLEVAHLAMEQQLLVIAEAASRWRVSRQLVAYGLYKAGRLSLDTWKALDGRIRESWMTQRRQDKEAARLKKTSGPTYYIVRRHRLGAAMLDFAHRHLDAGTLSPVKAARVLGVKPRSVYPLLMSA